MATSSWDLARSRYDHEFALLERRAVLERRFEVMERPATETEEKRLYDDLGMPRTWTENGRLYEKLEWPRKELERQF